MTRIDFYHGAADKLLAACQLVGELYREGCQVWIYAPEPALAAAVDRALWTQPATGFVPHCLAESRLASETPVIIGRSPDPASHDDVLVNLDADPPAGFSRFRRLIEIVGSDEADKAPARSRFKHYRDRGYPLSAQDFATRRASP